MDKPTKPAGTAAEPVAKRTAATQSKPSPVALAAVDIIKAGLEGGAIKLKGNEESKNASTSAASDAGYLAALFHGLVAGLSKKTK